MTGEALRQAILAGDVQAVREALALEPTRIEWKDESGAPLHFLAAREAPEEMVRFLVEYGLRVNLRDVDARGRDMLHYAAEGGNVGTCRYLVERGGMDPLRADRELTTPFDLARRGSHAALEAYFEGVVGCPLDGLYRNPIRRGMWPDPSIVRVGEDYYMVNSSFVYFPCIPVSHSRDLVHWRVIGHAITRPEWANLDGLEGGRGYWAPDISYANGRFTICATLRLNDEGTIRRRQMVVSSERPEGPYSEPVFFEEDGIDPSIFHDDDGRHYMLLNRGARIFEVDETATKRLSETTMLYYGSNKRAVEGPHLIKRDGWYYLFLAEGGTGMDHRETVARSRTLHGVYEPSPYGPVIRQEDERALIQRCGHAKPVQAADGEWYFVYLCGRALDGNWTMLGRETALDRLIWTADGWPLLACERGGSAAAPLPLPEAERVSEVSDWLTPRPPAPGEIEWKGDRVTIRGSAFPMTDTRCRSLCVRRQTAFRFAFSAVLTVPDGARGEAGVTCYYDEHSFLNIALTGDGERRRVCVTEQIGEDGGEAASWDVHAEPGARVTFAVRADGLTRVLRWSMADGQGGECALASVTYLADEGVRIGKRFTGAMVGMYALGGMTATFEEIDYREE